MSISNVSRHPRIAVVPAAALLITMHSALAVAAPQVVATIALPDPVRWDYVSVDPAGPRCRCGAQGCLEVVAGLEAVTRAAGLTPTQGLPHGVALTAAAEAGDSATLAALEAAARALATALGGALHLLDVGTVVLGGAYARLAPWLVPTLSQCLQERLLWSSWEGPIVRPAARGAEAASLGGARSVVSRLLSEPERWLVT